MIFKPSISSFVLLSLSCFAIAGCGGDSDPRHKDLVPASGTLFYKGEPVGGASIVFHHEDSSKQGGGATSLEDGTFSLRTFNGEGTYPGNYKVTAIKDNVVSLVSDEELLRLEREGKDIPGAKIEQLLPAKYRLRTSTDIEIAIPAAGDKNLTIELTD